MTHHLKQTEPTLFPNEQEPERESNAWHVQADCPTKECAEHIRNCLNIIQQFAEISGVDPVLLAQRMSIRNIPDIIHSSLHNLTSFMPDSEEFKAGISQANHILNELDGEDL